MSVQTQAVIDKDRVWNKLMPVATVQCLPQQQQANRLGYIANAKDWAKIWQSWHPEHTVPKVDFKTEIVVWIRNTRYLNHIKLAGVQVKDSTAVVAARETRSAKPIKDELHCLMFVLNRKGVKRLSDGSKSIEVIATSN
jgi:hypothetical protein